MFLIASCAYPAVFRGLFTQQNVIAVLMACSHSADPVFYLQAGVVSEISLIVGD